MIRQLIRRNTIKMRIQLKSFKTNNRLNQVFSTMNKRIKQMKSQDTGLQIPKPPSRKGSANKRHSIADTSTLNIAGKKERKVTIQVPEITGHTVEQHTAEKYIRAAKTLKVQHTQAEVGLKQPQTTNQDVPPTVIIIIIIIQLHRRRK